MKVTEFEAKLTIISDAKLLQMLATSRRDGPEVAVKMISAEAVKRGLEGIGTEPLLDSKDSVEPITYPGFVSETKPSEIKVDPSVEAAMEAAATQAVGYGGGSKSADSSAVGETLDGVPAGGSNWLTEETSSSKLPVIVKVLFFILGLGAVVIVALKFIHRG